MRAFGGAGGFTDFELHKVTGLPCGAVALKGPQISGLQGEGHVMQMQQGVAILLVGLG